jgi:hypothetical protein
VVFTVGVVVGVASSFVAWLLVQALIRPNLEISGEISRLPAPSDYGAVYLYRIMIRNRRWRRCLDVDYNCAFRMTGVHQDRETNTSVYVVPLDEITSTGLDRRANRIVWVRIHEAEQLVTRLPAALQKKVLDGTIRLEELLRLPGASLRFSVRCTDGFSNVARLRTMTFETDCVGIGQFDKKTGRLQHGLLRESHEPLARSVTGSGPTK